MVHYTLIVNIFNCFITDPNRKMIKEHRMVIPPSLDSDHEARNLGLGVPHEWDGRTNIWGLFDMLKLYKNIFKL